MKPAPFDYIRPTSVTDALAAVRDDPDAKLLAGGQSLLPMMNLRLARPSTLIDIGGLAELGRVFEDVDSLVIGALVRHRRIERDPLFLRRVPLAAEAARFIGHIGIRNRGTLGGTLAHADPAAEMPVVMLALGATFYAESLDRGRRAIPATEFFTSFFTTALEPDEMLTWVRVPALRERQGWGFVEFARRHGDFGMSGAAALVEVDARGRLAGVRAGIMSVGDRPLLVSDGRALAGEEPSDALWADAARAWVSRLQPAADAELALRLSKVTLRRALKAAHLRAMGEVTT